MDISFKKVEHIYMEKTPFEKVALTDVNVEIPSGTFTAIIGHTGSGKSSFIQHINGLLKPTKGTVTIGDFTITAGEKFKQMRELRQKVGMVFQFPEHQIFEETVKKDISFGPLNFGVTQEEIDQRMSRVLKQVELSEELLERSPFQLSGGQMRRVAIAGVLISRPEILVLDEPTAGLDPIGRKRMLQLFKQYHDENHVTTVFITHHMEDAVKLADHFIVLNDGKVQMVGSREDIFKEAETLRSFGLAMPAEIDFLQNFKKRFQIHDDRLYFELDQIAAYVDKHLREKE
ncbi:cobalt ABC transporter ATP-binding protein [Bacillus sp. TS-2]|nr:cobalt ABC transporter ATP-binding protein [Bacillus sp. TS-2]